MNGRRVRAEAEIEAAIAETGFTPNHMARSLKSGRTRSIGVVVPDVANPFFAQAVRGIEVSSRDDRYNIFLCNTDESATRQDEVLDSLIGRVDAVLLIPATESPSVPRALRMMRVPVVLLDREFAEQGLYDTVLVDNEAAPRRPATISSTWPSPDWADQWSAKRQSWPHPPRGFLERSAHPRRGHSTGVRPYR